MRARDERHCACAVMTGLAEKRSIRPAWRTDCLHCRSSSHRGPVASRAMTGDVQCRRTATQPSSSFHRSRRCRRASSYGPIKAALIRIAKGLARQYGVQSGCRGAKRACAVPTLYPLNRLNGGHATLCPPCNSPATSPCRRRPCRPPHPGRPWRRCNRPRR
jgi:hypothetical protein